MADKRWTGRDASFYRVDTASMPPNGHMPSPSASSLSHTNDTFMYSPQQMQAMPLNQPQTIIGSMSMSHINITRPHFLNKTSNNNTPNKPKLSPNSKQPATQLSHAYYGQYHYDNINEETDQYPTEPFYDPNQQKPASPTSPQSYQSRHSYASYQSHPSQQSHQSHHSFHQSYTNKHYRQQNNHNHNNHNHNHNNNHDLDHRNRKKQKKMSRKKHSRKKHSRHSRQSSSDDEDNSSSSSSTQSYSNDDEDDEDDDDEEDDDDDEDSFSYIDESQSQSQSESASNSSQDAKSQKKRRKRIKTSKRKSRRMRTKTEPAVYKRSKSHSHSHSHSHYNHGYNDKIDKIDTKKKRNSKLKHHHDHQQNRHSGHSRGRQLISSSPTSHNQLNQLNQLNQSQFQSHERTNRSNSHCGTGINPKKHMRKKKKSSKKKRKKKSSKKKQHLMKNIGRQYLNDKIDNMNENEHDEDEYKISPLSPRFDINNIESIKESHQQFSFTNSIANKTKTVKKALHKHHLHKETPVWRVKTDGTFGASGKKLPLMTSRSSPPNSDSNNTKHNHTIANHKRKKKSRSLIPTANIANIASIASTASTSVTSSNNNTSNSNTLYYKKEIISKSDKSFWPYYRLISDISRCDSHQLLRSIDNIYGLESLQSVLSQFIISKLRHSLNLTASDLLYLSPKELMQENDNNIFEVMRNNVPSLPHPSFIIDKVNCKNKNKNKPSHKAKSKNNSLINDSVTSPVDEEEYGFDINKVHNINLERLICKKEIGYRIISYLDEKTFIVSHNVSRQFLYVCRLPESRSHLMIRIGKLNDKIGPISVCEFIKNRINQLTHIQLLHLVIDKPKWDILKILLSKLLHLRQLDLMLPGLQTNYIMPTKMLRKECTMFKLKILRISGPRKLKLSQQYPDISYLMRDFLRKISMPNLNELWLMRVASKEKNTIRKFLNEYKSTLKSLEFELSISMNNSLTMLNEIYDFTCREVTAGKIPLKSLSFRLIRDIVGLFTYQEKRVNNVHKQQQEHNKATSLIGAINVSNRLNLKNRTTHDNDELDELYNKILDENEFKLRKICEKIVNELSSKVCFERLVFPGQVSKIHWNAINRLQTLRNLHIMIEPNDMMQGLDELCTQCGHTLTNLKLTIYNISSQYDQDLLYHLNKNLKECTKLRHVRLVIGHNIHDIGKVSIDSFCSFMIQHSSTLSTIELHCYYLTFDFNKLKQDQSDKIGVSAAASKFYIPDVNQELQERLEDLFFSCNHLKRIRIQHVTSHRKFVAVQRLFHGKPHSVGIENLDHFHENQFL